MPCIFFFHEACSLDFRCSLRGVWMHPISFVRFRDIIRSIMAVFRLMIHMGKFLERLLASVFPGDAVEHVVADVATSSAKGLWVASRHLYSSSVWTPVATTISAVGLGEIAPYKPCWMCKTSNPSRYIHWPLFLIPFIPIGSSCCFMPCIIVMSCFASVCLLHSLGWWLSHLIVDVFYFEQICDLVVSCFYFCFSHWFSHMEPTGKLRLKMDWNGSSRAITNVFKYLKCGYSSHANSLYAAYLRENLAWK